MLGASFDVTTFPGNGVLRNFAQQVELAQNPTFREGRPTFGSSAKPLRVDDHRQKNARQQIMRLGVNTSNTRESVKPVLSIIGGLCTRVKSPS
jgi:hypothetical protein